VEIQNFTAGHERVEAFLRAKGEHADCSGLTVHIKHTRAKRRDVTGYYRFADRRIVIAVKKRLKYPRRAAYGIGSKPVERQRFGTRPYRLVWFEETFHGSDELLIFVAGHEFWHFLCHSGQRRGDFEVRANCLGFQWLAEFQRWPGSHAPVSAFPSRPLRPDVAVTSPSNPHSGQGELFRFE
jgi:hypothetical protein